MKKDHIAPIAALLLLLGARPAAAQWQTQSLVVKPGWTAVYLFVDASYTNLDFLVGSDSGNPIQEIWMWQPAVSSIQYINNPLAPISGGSQWAAWERLGTGLPSTLASLAPNSAYLIHSTATTNYTWNVKGRPVAPVYSWNTGGINLIGFPTVTNNAPLLDNFLALAPTFQSVATIYQYRGGNLSANNPALVFAPHGVTVARGQAFWINETNFVNDYFGPFQVVAAGNATAFSTNFSSTSLRLINRTASALTINLTLQPSETPPLGQGSTVPPLPPVIVRGALNASNLVYDATSLNTAPLSWTLPPQGQSGADIALVLGVNRAAMTNGAGAQYAGILRFTDSRNFTEVDLPVSAQAGSYAGLWVGSVALSQVANYLKTYQTNLDGTMAQSTNGAYQVASLNTNLGPTAAPFPMRLILHNDGTSVNLLPRVYYGADLGSNIIVATTESALDTAQLGSARRISAVQFPMTNLTCRFTGQLLPGATLTAQTTIAYDDQANNPFLHTYHPDHDNLDATFQNQLPVGVESYQIDRSITLNLLAPGNDFVSLTRFGQTFSGAYAETLTLSGINFAPRAFNMAGAFSITRVSPIPVLSGPH